MAKALQALLTTLFFIAIIQKVSANECKNINVYLVKDSYELAQTMGKLKLFNLKYMGQFDDGEKIPLGSIALVDFPDKKPEIVEGKQLKKSIFHYQTTNGLNLIVKLANKNKDRKLASHKTYKKACLFRY